MARLNAEHRRPEADALLRLAGDAEYVAHLDAGTIEGGDVALHDGCVLVGLGEETSIEGAKALQTALSRRGVDREVRPVEFSVDGIVHLDDRFAIVAPATALIHRAVFLPAQLRWFEQHFDLIDVTGTEARAVQANVLALALGTVVVAPSPSPRSSPWRGPRCAPCSTGPAAPPTTSSWCCCSPACACPRTPPTGSASTPPSARSCSAPSPHVASRLSNAVPPVSARSSCRCCCRCTSWTPACTRTSPTSAREGGCGARRSSRSPSWASGAAGAARLTGSDWRWSVAVGTLMNCRGLTELVVLGMGREAGVITDDLFTLLVVMAVLTTAATAPALKRIARGDPQMAPAPPAAPSPRSTGRSPDGPAAEPAHGSSPDPDRAEPEHLVRAAATAGNGRNALTTHAPRPPKISSRPPQDHLPPPR